MKLSEEGIKHIQAEEGLRTEAYRDIGGVWTIGYGHTGPDVKPGLTISAEQADELFRKDKTEREAAVNSLVTTKIDQKQFDSLVSLVYNIGAGNLSKSALLEKLNKGDYAGAAEQFGVWNKVNKVDSKGLTARRNREKRIFRGEDAYSSTSLADTGTGGSSKLGASPSASDDKMLNQDKETLAKMEILSKKLDAGPDGISEQEYANRLRKEGGGIG